MTTKSIFLAFLVLNLLVTAGLGAIDSHLRTAHASIGIIAFEFCGFAGTCSDILAEWGVNGRSWAMLSLGLDYLYILTYAGGLCAGILWMSEGTKSDRLSVTKIIAGCALLAGIADAVENYALIQVLTSQNIDANAMLASYSASCKFALVLLALLTFVGMFIRRAVIEKWAWRRPTIR